MQQPLARWHDQLSDVGLWMGMATLGAIACISFAATMSRYFLGVPIAWVADWTGYMLVFTIFSAVPAVSRHGMHVSMDLLSSVIRAGLARRMLMLAAQVLTLVIVGALCVIVAQSLVAAWRAQSTTVAAYPIPRWWLMALVLYGLGSSALHLVRNVAGLLCRPAPGAPAASHAVSKD
jgi:TRAP-type C4-dicarboxylate transport system permease small subunit